MTRCIFSGMQILIEQQWVKDRAVIVDDHKITAIIPFEMIKHHLPAKQYHYAEHDYLVPGFIDLHVHGALNKDVMDANVEALQTISHTLASEGVTGFLATTMTANNECIEAVLKIMPTAMESVDGAALLGVHLEGPFIAKAKKGAQREDHIREPDLNLLKHWQTIAQGSIKRVTLAPELPQALDLIAQLREMSIAASVGHTDATYDETVQAIAAGCTQATHLFNAMRGLTQREPGAVGALLLADQVMAELIVDGVHLYPAVVELALRLKGKENLLLVTDAIRAKCLGDGCYDLGGQSVTVHADQATLADGTLAGSVLRMPDAILNMVKYTHCSLPDAIYMASKNPARALQLDAHKGTIAVGKDADLVVLNKQFKVMLTMRDGREVYTCTSV